MSSLPRSLIALCLCLGMWPASRSMGAEEPAYGAVLFNAAHQSIRQDVMNSGGKDYFSWPRGPYIENFFSPPSGPATSSYNGPHIKSKFLAITP